MGDKKKEKKRLGQAAEDMLALRPFSEGVVLAPIPLQ